MVKDLKGKAEQHKVEIRNIRREGNDYLKALKDNELSEDHQKGLITDIQELTDKNIDLVGKCLQTKKRSS